MTRLHVNLDHCTNKVIISDTHMPQKQAQERARQFECPALPPLLFPLSPSSQSSLPLQLSSLKSTAMDVEDVSDGCVVNA